MRAIWKAAAAAAAILLTLYLAADGSVLRQSAWLALVAGSTAAVLVGIRAHAPSSRRPWALLGVGLGMLTVVNLLEFPLWQSHELLLAVAMVLELIAFPIIGLATLDLVRHQTPHGDREGAIDGAIVMIALATLLSGTVFTPETLTSRTPLAYALLGVAPVVLAGVATAAMRLLFVGNLRVASTWLVAAAPVLALAGHVLRSLAQTNATYARGGVEDLPIGMAYALVGLAALHPSMVTLTQAAPTGERRLTNGRVAILGLALLAAPATLLMTGQVLIPVVASAALSLLVLLRLWRLVIERETGRNDMREQASHDPLTGLPNRTVLIERLDAALSRRAPADLPDAVLFLDLNGFKRVNDELGHAAGDELLVQVAERLRASHRAGDLIARLAGDEFVLVCGGIAESGVVHVTERVIAALERPFVLEGGETRVGVSVGVAFRTAQTAGAEALLTEADAAMYQAKQRNTSGYEIYGAELGERLRRRRRLEGDFATALAAGELRLEYQAIVPLETARPRRPVGFEALLRWDHPELGPVSPVEAVGVAESTGAVVALGAWVLRSACTQLARWNRGRERPLTVYVNVSTRELLNESMPSAVAAILAETGVDPGQVVIEVTEHAVLDTTGEGLRTLHAVRELGVRIALDDFGTGFSSLTHLKDVPFDLVKIDASFTRNLDVQIENRAIVEAVVSIADRLGAQVVCEGIEDTTQLEILRGLGCALGQGWLFGRPGPAPLYPDLPGAQAAVFDPVRQMRR